MDAAGLQIHIVGSFLKLIATCEMQPRFSFLILRIVRSIFKFTWAKPVFLQFLFKRFSFVGWAGRRRSVLKTWMPLFFSKKAEKGWSENYGTFSKSEFGSIENNLWHHDILISEILTNSHIRPNMANRLIMKTRRTNRCPRGV